MVYTYFEMKFSIAFYLSLCMTEIVLVVVVYDKPWFKGHSFNLLEWKTCVDLPPRWQNRISSIRNNQHCVRFCTKPSCNGKCIELNPSVNPYWNMDHYAMSKKIVSFLICDSFKNDTAQQILTSSTTEKSIRRSENCEFHLSHDFYISTQINAFLRLHFI